MKCPNCKSGMSASYGCEFKNGEVQGDWDNHKITIDGKNYSPKNKRSWYYTGLSYDKIEDFEYIDENVLVFSHEPPFEDDEGHLKAKKTDDSVHITVENGFMDITHYESKVLPKD